MVVNWWRSTRYQAARRWELTLDTHISFVTKHVACSCWLCVCLCVHRDFLNEGSSLSIYTVMQAPHLGPNGNKQVTRWLFCGAVLKSNRVGISQWDSNAPLKTALSSFRAAQFPKTAKSQAHPLSHSEADALSHLDHCRAVTDPPGFKLFWHTPKPASHCYYRNLFETYLNIHSSAQNPLRGPQYLLE